MPLVTDYLTLSTVAEEEHSVCQLIQRQNTEQENVEENRKQIRIFFKLFMYESVSKVINSSKKCFESSWLQKCP